MRVFGAIAIFLCLGAGVAPSVALANAAIREYASLSSVASAVQLLPSFADPILTPSNPPRSISQGPQT